MSCQRTSYLVCQKKKKTKKKQKTKQSYTWTDKQTYKEKLNERQVSLMKVAVNQTSIHGEGILHIHA